MAKINEKNKNIKLTDESESKQKPSMKGITYTDEERKILLFLKERYEKMSDKKKDLGIDFKCDLYDRMYTPHRILKTKNLDREFEASHLQIDDEDGRNANKSKPIAFEKIQTALAIMIKQNPRAFMKAFNRKWKPLNEMVKVAYEHNWDEHRLVIELRKFVFHLAKYGIAYGRRYIKKTYKIVHRGDIKEREVKFYDTIWETRHPKTILLDEVCDNPRNARDLFLIENRTAQELKDKYPEGKFPRMKFLEKGRWLTEQDSNYLSFEGNIRTKKDELYEELIYENEPKDVRLLVVNGILISGDDDPLPGHQLSVFGEKWADKDEGYDGIGICQIMENHQPLVDEISNSDIDLVREVIRPTLYIQEGLEFPDEAEDEISGQRVVKFRGDINKGLKWDRPTYTKAGREMLEFMYKEIDDGVGISKDLSALSEAQTLGQASYNRENSLRRLSIPLDSIKHAIEDDAKKALPLLKIVHSKPLKTYEVKDPAELEEAKAILEVNPKDERFVIMPDGAMIRRQFKEIEVGITKEKDVFVTSDDQKFWELIPSQFDWQGTINIIPMSFIPESEAMEQQATLQDLNILMGIQDVDEMGNAVLIDEDGKSYKINKVKLIKDYVKSRRKNPDEYLHNLTDMNKSGTMTNHPLTNPDNISPTSREKMGLPPAKG